jgi:hypothetical protein
MYMLPKEKKIAELIA